MTLTHQRLFFALWPDVETRRTLWQVSGKLHQVWGGRRLKPDTLHMTLVFLGDTPLEKIAAIREIAGTLEVPKFSLNLDRAACWRYNKVGFLSPNDSPPELLRLVYGLEDKLEEAGIAFDERPYKPHVTLLRNTRCTTQVPFEPICWNVNEFVLVSSTLYQDSGPVYQLIGRWKLKSYL